MGSASPLLRFRVYRVGDTHTPAQTHAGTVCKTLCVCVRALNPTVFGQSSNHTNTEAECKVSGKYSDQVHALSPQAHACGYTHTNAQRSTGVGHARAKQRSGHKRQWH